VDPAAAAPFNADLALFDALRAEAEACVLAAGCPRAQVPRLCRGWRGLPVHAHLFAARAAVAGASAAADRRPKASAAAAEAAEDFFFKARPARAVRPGLERREKRRDNFRCRSRQRPSLPGEALLRQPKGSRPKGGKSNSRRDLGRGDLGLGLAQLAITVA
jgi:hypothetical protein